MENATIIEPDMKKASTAAALKGVGIVVVGVGLVYMLNWLVGLRIFTDILKEFGITIGTGTIVLVVLLLIVAAIFIPVVMNWLKINKLECQFSAEGIQIDNGVGLTSNQIALRLDQVAKVNYSQGFGEQLTNTYTVSLEFTNAEIEKFEIPFVIQGDQFAAMLQNVVQQSEARQYANIAEQQQMENIVGRL